MHTGEGRCTGFAAVPTVVPSVQSKGRCCSVSQAAQGAAAAQVHFARTSHGVCPWRRRCWRCAPPLPPPPPLSQITGHARTVSVTGIHVHLFRVCLWGGCYWPPSPCDTVCIATACYQHCLYCSVLYSNHPRAQHMALSCILEHHRFCLQPCCSRVKNLFSTETRARQPMQQSGSV